MSADVRIPARWTTWWSRPVGWTIAHVVYRTQVSGREGVPRDVPVIFAANHLSLLDGPVMFGVSPVPMHILVKKEMFKGALGSVLRQSGQISVDRAGGREALTRAKALLDAGRNVGILPEGTRGSGAVQSLNSGVAWLALNTEAVVVPVGVVGMRLAGESVDHVARPGRQLAVGFGPALRFVRESGESGRDALARVTLEIRDAMAAQVGRVQELSGLSLPADACPVPDPAPQKDTDGTKVSVPQDKRDGQGPARDDKITSGTPVPEELR